jgi:hypothetical protein
MIKPFAKELKVIYPPDNDNSAFPYLAWGFGLSPQHRDQTVAMLVVAWGRLIQLCILHDDGEMELDGYYYSSNSVDNVHFLSESVLFTLVNRKEVKIIYTPNLAPGSFFNEG